jgi:hypothetical protein
MVVATLSGLAALTTAAPYAMGLHDRAENSIELCGRYGALYGELLRAQSQLGTRYVAQPRVAELIEQFDDVTTRKDALRLAARDADTDAEA